RSRHGPDAVASVEQPCVFVIQRLVLRQVPTNAERLGRCLSRVLNEQPSLRANRLSGASRVGSFEVRDLQIEAASNEQQRRASSNPCALIHESFSLLMFTGWTSRQ